MSGPKVVRIVTREEVQAIGRRLLANAEQAVEELRRTATKHAVLDQELSANLNQRLKTLQRLFDEDRWLELQKQVPLTVTFLHGEIEQLHVRAIAAAEGVRTKRRRLADAATTLASAIEAAGTQPPPALADIAKRASAADERELASMQSILNESYAMLTPVAPKATVSREQVAFADRLRHSDVSESFARWLAEHSPKNEPRDARLDALIAKIETLEDAQAARPFLERARALDRESTDRKALLTDSLVLDLAERARRRRVDDASAIKLREMQAGLRTLGTSESLAMNGRIASVLESANFDGADELLRGARSFMDQEMAKLAAVARCRAVLEGLSELGYEVREAMETVWARDGRLVLRKPGASDYGVELGAPPDASRLQVRLVGSDRPSSMRDAGRDRDMETIWCSEFARLGELVASRGGEVVIERAADVGTQSVKTVPFAEVDREIRETPTACLEARVVRSRRVRN